MKMKPLSKEAINAMNKAQAKINFEILRALKLHTRKTTAQLRAQELRINKLLWENTASQIKQAHPETGGSLHLCSNWGNVEAKKYLQQHQDREYKLFSAFREHYTQAFKKEYPEHMINR